MDHHALPAARAPRIRRLPALLVLGGLAGPLLTGPGGPAAARADVEQARKVERTFTIRGPITLDNLAGRITARLAAGGATGTTITATIHAAAADAAAAAALLAALDLEMREENGGVVVEARYPLDRHRVYRYPAAGDGNATSESTYRGKKVRITTGRDDDAVTLWVDFDLVLARGVGLRGKQMAGNVDLTGIDGPVEIESGRGDMTFSGLDGTLDARTGSGRLDIRGHRGAVVLRTGSGEIATDDIDGSLVAETGSGDVHAGKATGRLEITTGSGDVLARGAGAAVKIDTGSGDVRIIEMGGREIEVGTGSGSIRVESPALFRGPAAARARFATGAGDVVLTIDDQASMLLEFSGSGEVERPDALARRLERVGDRGSHRYQIGQGVSRVEVDSGAGDVVIRLAGD